MIRKVALIAVDVRSAHNVGSFFRTADGFGAHVVLVGITPRPMMGAEDDDRLPHVAKKAHKAIAKTALGAEETVTWRYFRTFDEAVHGLRKQNYQIYAVEQDSNSKDIKTMPDATNIGLVVGPEIEGLPKDALAQCDGILEIPMSGQKESFNVSVAAAIALYQSTV